jgi:hypothetical protein
MANRHVSSDCCCKPDNGCYDNKLIRCKCKVIIDDECKILPALASEKSSCIDRFQMGSNIYATRTWAAYAQQSQDIPPPTGGYALDWEELEGTYTTDQQKVVGAHKRFDHDSNGALTAAGLAEYKKHVNAITSCTPDVVTLANIKGYPGNTPNTVAHVGVMSAFSGNLWGPTSTFMPLPDSYKEFSNEAMAEMVEIYARNIALDVPFSLYNHPTVESTGPLKVAIDALNKPSVKQYFLQSPAGHNKSITSANIFRGNYVNNTIGPFVSQFLLANINGGEGPAAGLSSWTRVQRYRAPLPITRYSNINGVFSSSITPMTGVSWVYNKDQAAKMLNDAVDSTFPTTDASTRSENVFIYNGRSMGALVADEPRCDLPYNSALILANWGVAFNPGLPHAFANATTYNNASAIINNLPDADINRHPAVAQANSAVAANMVHTLVYYWKYMRNRRIRPEAMGLYTHNTLTGTTGGLNYGMPSWYTNLSGELSELSDLWKAVAADNKNVSGGTNTTDQYTYHVQRRPGAPRHPSYPAGHSATAGAGFSMLKFMYDGSVKLSTLAPFKLTATGGVNPILANSDDVMYSGITGVNSADGGKPIYLEASEDGKKLIVRLMTQFMIDNWTVGDELNKMAGHVAHARDFTGVHFRADGNNGILWSEKACIRLCQDLLSVWATNNIDYSGSVPVYKSPVVTFKGYQGDTITVKPHFCS